MDEQDEHPDLIEIKSKHFYSELERVKKSMFPVAIRVYGPFPTTIYVGEILEALKTSDKIVALDFDFGWKIIYSTSPDDLEQYFKCNYSLRKFSAANFQKSGLSGELRIALLEGLAGANALKDCAFGSLFSCQNRKLTDQHKVLMAEKVKSILSRHSTKMINFELRQEFSDMQNGLPFEIICQGISSCASLLSLNLSRCSIGDGGFEVLAQHLPAQLESLILEGADLGPESFKKLPSLSCVANLKCVSLDQNKTSDESGAACIELVQNAPQLIHLSVNKVLNSSEQLEALFRVASDERQGWVVMNASFDKNTEINDASPLIDFINLNALTLKEIWLQYMVFSEAQQKKIADVIDESLIEKTATLFSDCWSNDALKNQVKQKVAANLKAANE